MIERPVNVGDVLTAQVVAKLDPQIQQNELRSAQGTRSSLQAQLIDARLTFDRQQALLKEEATPRARFDEARQRLESIQAEVDAAQAQVRIAEEARATVVRRHPGAVTAVGANRAKSSGRGCRQLASQGGRRRRCRATQSDGPARSAGADRSHQRPDRAGHRSRAGGGAPGGCHHPNVPGQGRLQLRRKAWSWDPLSPAASSCPRQPAWRSLRARSPRPTGAPPCGWSIRTARLSPCAAWIPSGTTTIVYRQGRKPGSGGHCRGCPVSRPGQKVRLLEGGS